MENDRIEALEKSLAAHKSYTHATTFALMGAIAALIKTHPDPAALAAELENQRNLFLVTLVPDAAAPERTIATYHRTWKRLMSESPLTPTGDPAA